ncbi:hypothetical protein M569_10800 [Genlisea aurea]|uniref:Uncharacterized protein n=1 Tax=Genlisea aurea TaxID=192259 RepID=S8CAP3_9LAMI|nr:hypothetical protein M569_10800 [Genlisea aurea]
MGSNEYRAVKIEETGDESMEIDVGRSHFPHCIVWSPLPILSWLFPFIGHMGICRSDGVILDFASSNFVCVDSFAFGAPTRYLQLSKDQCRAFYGEKPAAAEGMNFWDEALMRSTQEYQHRSYNILTCNCHSFVANCLNRLGFRDRNWNVVSLAVFAFLGGRFVGKSGAVRTFLPFAAASAVGIALAGVAYFGYLAAFLCVLVGWFVVSTYCFRNVVHV